MAITEVYNNPTVTQVIFQIVFPNFFSMESKIGDYQLKIMEKFPKSTLLIQNQFLISQPGGGVLNPSGEKENLSAKKIWQFKSENEDVTIHITSDSLDVSSLKHKTYNNAGSANKFRDTIGFAVDQFLSLIPVFKISKMGLRYINTCPLPEKLTKETFLEYYNSYINFTNIKDIQNVELMDFTSTIKESNIFVRYRETLSKSMQTHQYILDFDGQMADIQPKQYLSELDKIHSEISLWYENIIKEPVIKIMRS